MKESIEKRIELVKTADTGELKKHLCPFFSKGGSPDCITCKCTDEDLEGCRDYYLERIALIPKDIWDEEFDKVIIQDREKIAISEIVGIGINCNNCYMSDKCPKFKAGYVCAIDWGDKRPTTPHEFVDFLVNMQYDRVKRASVFEQIDGGVPDAYLSDEIDRMSNLVSMKDNMGRDRLSINLEASSAGGGGGGILSKLFGGGSTKPAIESPTTKTIEDTDFEEIEKLKAPKKKSEV